MSSVFLASPGTRRHLASQGLALPAIAKAIAFAGGPFEAKCLLQDSISDETRLILDFTQTFWYYYLNRVKKYGCLN